MKSSFSRRIFSGLLALGRAAGQVVLAIAVLIATYVGLIYFAEDYRNFRKLENGMDRAQVEAIMGKARVESNELGALCSYSGWKAECAQARQKNVRTFLHWRWGMESLAVVGLDEQNKAAVLMVNAF